MRGGCRIRSIAIAAAIALAATIVALPPAHASALLTDIVPPTGVGLDRGIASLRCRAGRSSWYSRGAVVAVDGGIRDVILTTAHGLPETVEEIVSTCRIVGRPGQAYGIEEVWRSPTPMPGNEHDWAVLLTKRRISGDVGRLRVAVVSADSMMQLVAAEVPVRLLLRYAPVTEGDCRLRAMPAGVLPSQLVAYSCGSAPGLSGSPVVVGIGGATVIIGVHLGWGIRDLRDPGSNASYARIVDDSILDALTAASARALPGPVAPGAFPGRVPRR